MRAKRVLFFGNIPLGNYNDQKYLLLRFLENRFIAGSNSWVTNKLTGGLPSGGMGVRLFYYNSHFHNNSCKYILCGKTNMWKNNHKIDINLAGFTRLGCVFAI